MSFGYGRTLVNARSLQILNLSGYFMASLTKTINGLKNEFTTQILV